MVASLLRLPSLGYTVDFPLGYALSRGCSPLRYGCLLRSRLISLRFTLSGLPSAVFLTAFDYVALRAACGRLPSQRPLACVRSRLISLRFTLSGLPLAGYPASARWHVFVPELAILPPRSPRLRVRPSAFTLHGGIRRPTRGRPTKIRGDSSYSRGPLFISARP